MGRILLLLLICCGASFLAPRLSAAEEKPAEPPFRPESGSPPKPAKGQRLFHQLGLDLGSDADPDLLEPAVPRGLDRHFEWDYRFVSRDDGLGFNAHYRNPARLQKLTLTYKKRMDVPARLGVGRTRDRTYDALNQTLHKNEDGFVLGAAVVLNQYWGLNLRQDEFIKDGPGEHFLRWQTGLGLGFSPLGDNQGKHWNFSLDPAVSYERFHGLEPVPGVRYESLGYGFGPTFYYGLDWVRIPHVLGPGQWFRLDRFKANVRIADSETTDLAVTTGLNLTAYATRHLKLSLGAGDDYLPSRGRRNFHLKTGASVRISWSDLPF